MRMEMKTASILNFYSAFNMNRILLLTIFMTQLAANGLLLHDDRFQPTFSFYDNGGHLFFTDDTTA